MYECVYECVYVCACLNMRVYKHMCVSVEVRGTVHFMFLLGKLFAGLELPSRVGRLASWPGIPAICFSSHPVLGLYATIKTLLFCFLLWFWGPKTEILWLARQVLHGLYPTRWGHFLHDRVLANGNKGGNNPFN